ncbi:MAG: hypothetical protein RLZZ387_2599 [Chloroflexota bacterium]|jgi:hypothetical protein
MTEPEHGLIILCRRIAKENPDFRIISFTVVRDDDESQSFTIERKRSDD